MAINLVLLHNCYLVELVVSFKVVKLRKPREVRDIKGVCVYSGNTFAAAVR